MESPTSTPRGATPAISIDQKGTPKNPRPTVGTVTEATIYVCTPESGAVLPRLGREVRRQTVTRWPTTSSSPRGMRVMVLGPVVKGRKGEYNP
jgi:excinuclease ABC subunit A